MRMNAALHEMVADVLLHLRHHNGHLRGLAPSKALLHHGGARELTVTNLDRTSQRNARPNTVLVADDDHGVGGALQLLFELNGLFVDVVHTPLDAMERVRQGDVRIVIHDMKFSRGETSGDEGLALFRDVRREAPEVAVILMTSWPAAGTHALVLQEGATAYLTKPWDDRSLLALVQRLLGV
jgi:DNA-binding NtrC family response regulator